jgi:hypothetical protein
VRIVGGRAAVTGDYAPQAGEKGRYSVVAFVENPATGEVLQVAEVSSCGS